MGSSWPSNAAMPIRSSRSLTTQIAWIASRPASESSAASMPMISPGPPVSVVSVPTRTDSRLLARTPTYLKGFSHPLGGIDWNVIEKRRPETSASTTRESMPADARSEGLSSLSPPTARSSGLPSSSSSQMSSTALSAVSLAK